MYLRKTYWGAATLGCVLLMMAGCPLFPVTPDPGGDSNEPMTPMTGNSGLTGKFVGSTRCSQCHANQHADWDRTLHAHALDTLEAIGQGENADCIGCHTVGFGEDGGFVDRATTNDLAGVGCESCHGPSADHANNVNDETLRPKVDVSPQLCGTCHTGSHHPHIDELLMSGHGSVTEHVDERLVGGSISSCGQCHSGTVYLMVLEGETVPEDLFVGQEVGDLIGVSCAVCHDPHAKTGNGADTPDGRDFQLRFPQIAAPFPTNTIAATTDPTRFNLCGQCHHSRGRDWTVGSRGPHHSVQSNVYTGEMPMPDSGDEDPVPLVPSIVHKHIEAAEQCSTCHMYRQDFMDDNAPAISGHTFEVNFAGCILSGCHSSESGIETRFVTGKDAMMVRIEEIKTRLGDPATWQYSSEGGPGNDGVSENVQKIRFLISYIESDGSYGIHNPDYVESMLTEAEQLLEDEGL